MTSVISSGVSGSSSQQASRLALLTKLFQTTGKTAREGEDRPVQGAAAPPPPPPPPPPAQSNSAGGLASMFEGLPNTDGTSISDLLATLLQAEDSDGNGTISTEELAAAAREVAGGTTASVPLPYLAPSRPDDAGDDGMGLADDAAARGVAGPLGRDFATVDSDQDGQLSQIELDAFDAQTQGRVANTGSTVSAYEALFQAMQMVFTQGNGSAANGGQRYTELLQSLAKAG